jgi:polysaccharide biosynthesis transport protein
VPTRGRVRALRDRSPEIGKFGPAPTVVQTRKAVAAMAYDIYGAPSPYGGTAMPGYGQGPGDSFSPLHLLARAWARKMLLFGVATALFAALAAAVFTIPPLYTATAQVLIEAPPGQPTNPLQPPVAQEADQQKMMSEVQVLMSRAIAEKVISRLDLADKPEFNPALDKGLLARFAGGSPTHGAIVDLYYKRLNVYQVSTSRVIAVEFSSHDPALARDAANAVAELYIAGQREARLDLNAQARAWLSQQIDALRSQVARSEAKVEDFRAKTGLLAGAGAELQSQQLTDLSTQLTAARAARSEADARVANLERLVGSGQLDDDAAAGAPEVLQSPLIQQLRTQEVELKREITQMSADLLPTHPKMIEKQAELDDLQQQIRNEIAKVLEGVKNEAAVAASREQALAAQFKQLEARRAVADQNEVQLRALERDAAADRSVLESMLSRYTEVSTRGDLSIQEANARVISHAELPDAPSFPQKAPMLTLAAMLGMMGGSFAVFVAELRGVRPRRTADVEQLSGHPVFASLPAVGAQPEDEALRRPAGLYANGIRSLHARLAIGPRRSGRGRVVLVTSTVQGEGRTTTAIAFARFMAQAGLRVLLIESDFQNPALGPVLRLPAASGFSDLLAARAGYRQAILRDSVSDLHVIEAGHTPPTAVFAPERLKPVLTALARAYDVIVFDAGPVDARETQALAPFSDNCIYTVRWDAAERGRMVAGLNLLARAGMRGPAGVVLNCEKATV